MKAIKFGSFDLLRYGYIWLLGRILELGDNLIVGISAGEFSLRKKERVPHFTPAIVRDILHELKYVAGDFYERCLEEKGTCYIERCHADTMDMDDDWRKKFD